MPTEISGATGVNKVQTGAIETGDMPTGSVLQVVSATNNTQAQTSGTTATDTGLTATITPSATSRKIMVFVSQGLGVERNDPYHQANLLLLRGTTVLQTAKRRTNFPSSSYTFESETQSINYLDSPNTTSATTYKTQFKCQHGTNSELAIVNNLSHDASITLMEIAG